MTTTMTPTSTPAPVPARPRASTPPPPVRPRRWHRVVIPFALVALYWGVTFAVHSQQTPSLRTASTLSPDGTGPYGSSVLAQRVRDRGVDLRRVTSSADALSLAKQYGQATLFVPTPDYLQTAFGESLPDLSGQYRVVVVQPGLRTEFRGTLPIEYGPSRWASAVTTPGCALPEAVRAGRAEVVLDRYGPLRDTAITYQTCYAGGLIDARMDTTSGSSLEYVVVGASDPFRNDRIGEVGNSDLALGLLASLGPLIWVDVHQQEPEPTVSRPISLPSYQRDNQDRSGGASSFFGVFPSLLWVGLIGVLGALLLLALAQARRLGAPVAEPLPVLVPAAEVVAGRGRLFDRIDAHEASLTTLRAAAIRRLYRAVDPFGGRAGEAALLPDRLGSPPIGVDDFVSQVADRAGLDATAVRDILYGRGPDTAEELTAAVDRLDRLLDAALHGPVPAGPRSDHPLRSAAPSNPFDHPVGGTP